MGNGGAAAGVGMDGTPSSVAIMSVVGAAGARRARDPVRRQSAVRDVVVDRLIPEERPPIRGSGFFLAVERRRLPLAERVGGDLEGGFGGGGEDDEEESEGEEGVAVVGGHGVGRFQ